MVFGVLGEQHLNQLNKQLVSQSYFIGQMGLLLFCSFGNKRQVLSKGLVTSVARLFLIGEMPT